MIGQEMLVKLQLTGKNCQMHTDPEIIKSISRKLTKKDSVIFCFFERRDKRTRHRRKELL